MEVNSYINQTIVFRGRIS